MAENQRNLFTITYYLLPLIITSYFNERSNMHLPRPQFTSKTTQKEIARYLVSLIEAIERVLAEMEGDDGE